MLRHLSVRDLAIVTHIETDFEAGMTVLTGETGAGKSITVDALELAMGSRGQADMVRAGSDAAEIVAIFDTPPGSAAAAWLEAAELGGADDECIVRRVVNARGRSRAWINGTPVPLQSLRDLGVFLVDIHGQHTHQALLDSGGQRAILDAYAGSDVELGPIADICARWRANERELAHLSGDSDAHAELLRYQAREIDALGLEPGSVERLEAEHTRLTHAEEIATRTEDALTAIEGAGDGDGGATRCVATAVHALARVAEHDPRIAEACTLLDSVAIELTEAGAQLRRFSAGVAVDPARLADLDHELSVLHDLARKHRIRPVELLEFAAGLRAELERIERGGARRTQLIAARATLLAEFDALCTALHTRRSRAAAELDTAVGTNLHKLGMEGGRFAVSVEPTPRDAPSPYGADRVTFEVTANPGQPLRPLERVASGGELSRISLAIQSIDSRARAAPCVLFDEVDAGVGGRVAETVGIQLRRLADRRQVLCVTHLPQVASHAHQHLQVTKIRSQSGVGVTLSVLDKRQRIDELARMLGGGRITTKTIEHASEMLELAG